MKIQQQILIDKSPKTCYNDIVPKWGKSLRRVEAPGDEEKTARSMSAERGFTAERSLTAARD